MSLKDRAKQLKTDIPAFFIAMRKKETPPAAKILAGITVGYALSPIDLIPDFIPLLGYLDDVILLPLLIALTIKLIPKEVFAQCRKESEGLWENGKPKKWYYALPILLIWLLLVVAVGLINLWPLLSMRAAATGSVADTEIIAVNNGLNSLYFLPSSDGYIAIDAGTNADKAVQVMKEVGIDPLDVKHVLLTHSDSDHVAALTLFSNAQIYMGEDELQMVDGTTRRNATQFNALPEGVDQSALVLLQDGQELSLGGHPVVCIKAPGHTPGSMAYKLDGAYLFTGDAIRVAGGGITTHPFTMDEELASSSIQILKGSMGGCELVLTAHYGQYPSETLE